MVVVEGEVPNDEAKENLEALLEAASTDEVKVVGMVTTRADRDHLIGGRAADGSR
jgi:hypothetical protein